MTAMLVFWALIGLAVYAVIVAPEVALLFLAAAVILAVLNG
jgi:hypothetical protein